MAKASEKKAPMKKPMKASNMKKAMKKAPASMKKANEEGHGHVDVKKTPQTVDIKAGDLLIVIQF